MYEVGVKRKFIAQHHLIGGDWGDENKPHSHHYEAEVVLYGPQLDTHGYLFDIAPLMERLDWLVGRYRDRSLNDLEEFAGLNPSIEHFARIFAERLTDGIEFPGVKRLRVAMWEDGSAWAGFTRELAGAPV